MEQLIKHYGPAILAVIVFLALGAILVNLLALDGDVATEFSEMITNFFDNMNAIKPTPTPGT